MKKSSIAVLCLMAAGAFAGPAGTVKIWDPATGGAAAGSVKVVGAVDAVNGATSNLTEYVRLNLGTNTYLAADGTNLLFVTKTPPVTNRVTIVPE